MDYVIGSPVSVVPEERETPAAAGPPARFGANNFDLLRLLLAAGVMCSHLYKLSREEAFAGLAKLVNSTALVQSFFVISGFLIFMSYEKSKSLPDYFDKRLRRIYPAYVVVVLLCAAAGSFLTQLPLARYFSAETCKYLEANLLFLVFLHPTLPGVFENNFVHAVNGSLWTLKVELGFYVSVPIICWLMRRYHRPTVLAVLYVASLVYAKVFWMLGQHELAKQFPGQLCFFVAGAALYYYFSQFARNAVLWLALAVTVIFADHFLALGWLIPVCIAIATVFLACFVPVVPGPGYFGDLSYGVYIYHFPVIQTLVHFGIYRWSPVAGAALTLGLTGGLAFASWHLVEKRFLRRSSHYRRAAEAPAVEALT